MKTETNSIIKFQPLRKVERLTNGNWEEIQIQDLHTNDIFRLTEPHKTTPFGSWVTVGEPYLIDGVWGVRCYESKIS